MTLSGDVSQSPVHIKQHVFFPFTEEPTFTTITSLLSSLSKNYQLKNANCTYVLSHDMYRLLLINIPSRIKDEDLRTSAPLLVSEMIDFPEENLATDIFLVPTNHPKEKKAYVTIIKKDELVMRQQQIITADIPLRKITISDLSLSYIAAPQGKDCNLILLTISPTYGNMLFLQDQSIALSHQLNTRALFTEAMTPELIESAAKDIKRAIQFYLSNHNNDLPVKMILAPMSENRPEIVEALSQQLDYPFESLEIDKLFDFENPIDQTQAYHLIYALGVLLTPGEPL